MPYAIKALIGDKGIIAFFVLLFMALTSTVSSSMIAVSSILSFDIYKTYINPKASDRRLVKVSHLAVVAHAIFITCVSLAMNYGGANMTWIGYFRPILTCPGIIPLIFALTWSGQTRLAAILSPILGFLTGLAIWLGVAKSMYGTINLTTTGSNFPALYGAIGSFFSPALYSILISQYKPYKFDWREFLRIELLEDVNIIDIPTIGASSLGDEGKKNHNGDETITPLPVSSSVSASSQDLEKVEPTNEKTNLPAHALPASDSPRIINLEDIVHPFSNETLKELHHWYKIAWIFWVIVVLVTFVLWPLPLYRNYIFTKRFFGGWVTVAIIWQFFAFGAVVIFPLYDGRRAVARGARGVWGASMRTLGRDEQGS